MRRTFFTLFLVILLLSVGYYFYRQRQANQQPILEILRQATVEQGRIQATVNATGTILPEAQLSLTFGLPGTIQQVNVIRGQMVTAGDVLAVLNRGELELTVEQARQALMVQELTLQQRLESQPSPAVLAASQADIDAANGSLAIAEANLAGAQAGVSQAQAQLAQIQAGVSPAEIAAAQANLTARQAEAEVLRVQYNQAVLLGLAGPQEAQLRVQVEAAEAGVAAAQAQVDVLLAGPRPADIQLGNAAVAAAQAQVAAAEGNVLVAQANVDRAQAAYNRLFEQPTETEIAILNTQVEAARTNLALAELRLGQSMIVAPISGRVANVLIKGGEQAAPGAPAIILVDEAGYHIEVGVDEIDIEQVAVDQAVQITLDAAPGQIITGTVSEVAPTAGGAGGVVSYLVVINLGQSELTLRPGMTANAAIIVQQIDNVLIAPNWSIRLDRESGQAFVNRLVADGSVEEVAVETGLRNEQFSQIITGLNEGDQLVVTNERETFSLFGNE